MNLTRRSFLISTSALAAMGGCRALGFAAGKPRLQFGVLADIHVITPESANEFVAALEYFRDRGVDAVVVCGDITDWGLLSSLKYVAEAWNQVFPNNRAPDGRRVEKLFCSGNHDYEGYWYGDMTMEMHALGYSEDEALVRLGFKKCWEEVFQEAWAPVRRRTVKGYDFISGEWHGYDKQDGYNLAPKWLDEHRAELKGEKPCFYFQHFPIAETTGDSRRDGKVASPLGLSLRQALAGIPNMVAFTGHCHWTFNDPKSIWQGEFTSIAVPSMSYTTIPKGYENGSDVRNGKSTLVMQKIPSRINLEEAQGYLVSVHDDRLEVERHDFEQHADVGTWVIPWPPADKPFTLENAAAREAVPQFPDGAKLKTYTVNCDNRAGKWAIALSLDFPAATGRGFRAFDYEVRAVLADGTVAKVKRFLSPAFHKLPQDEPGQMQFRWDVAELPQDIPYTLEVYPRNAFGKCGAPLKTAERRGKPGLDKAPRFKARP